MNNKHITCSKCGLKELNKRKGAPGRWYCTHPRARECYRADGCSPALICKTDRHNENVTIKSSPRWCPQKHNLTPFKQTNTLFEFDDFRNFEKENESLIFYADGCESSVIEAMNNEPEVGPFDCYLFDGWFIALKK